MPIQIFPPIPNVPIGENHAWREWFHRLSTIVITNLNLTSANVPNTVVKRDNAGNFSAGAITASLTGNASTASNLSGTPTLPNGTSATTQAITDNSTKIATTAFVKGLFTPITASLGGDVSLNNIANYFDGPSIAQGTSGIWFVSGTVTVEDTGGAAAFFVKLWDGTTVISSARGDTAVAGGFNTVAVSGYISSPAGNLRISVRDATNATGKIIFNASGNSKDSTITAVRIG